MPQNYPGFIIDRSRRAKQSNHTDDYIVNTDTSVGFIARVYKLNKTQYDAHNKRVDAMNQDEADCTFITKNFGNAAIVVEVIHHLYPPMVDKPRMKSLLKKALKAYLYGEVAEIGTTDIDKQIAIVAEMKRLAISQMDNLILNNSESTAEYMIQQLHAAIESLTLLKQMYNCQEKSSQN